MVRCGCKKKKNRRRGGRGEAPKRSPVYNNACEARGLPTHRSLYHRRNTNRRRRSPPLRDQATLGPGVGIDLRRQRPNPGVGAATEAPGSRKVLAKKRRRRRRRSLVAGNRRTRKSIRDHDPRSNNLGSAQTTPSPGLITELVEATSVRVQ